MRKTISTVLPAITPVNPAGRSLQGGANSTPSYQTTPTTQARLRPAPLDPPGCGSSRPAEALESEELRARRGGAGSRGGGARAGAGGRRARPEGGCERAGGRRGPGAAGPERRSRHVRQREAQPGLHHRAPAGRWAGVGKVRARQAQALSPSGSGARAGLRLPGASVAWAGTGREVPWLRPPPRPRASALERAPGPGTHAWPGLRLSLRS